MNKKEERKEKGLDYLLIQISKGKLFYSLKNSNKEESVAYQKILFLERILRVRVHRRIIGNLCVMWFEVTSDV